jgi:hypothetical protein
MNMMMMMMMMMKNKLSSTRLGSVMSLIWQHVSTSDGRLQASSTKYRVIKNDCRGF